MSKSVRRVEIAAAELGLEISVCRMGQTARTAKDAALACGCSVAQIVKSLIFQGQSSGDLVLLLVSGSNEVDLLKAAVLVGENLQRAKPDDVRSRTGFAIGGVSPIGHVEPIKVWMDQDLMVHPSVWAAAGAPDAVFKIPPATLAEATQATVADISKTRS